MKSYTIHEPPKPAADRLDRAERLVFVKDGFSFLAAFFSPIWMVLNGLWLVLFIYFVVQAALILTFDALGTGQAVQAAVALALNLIIGFEADSLKRWTLERRGWQLVGTVTGENRDVCERRFFEAWLPNIPTVDPQTFHGFETAGATQGGRAIRDGDANFELSRPVPRKTSWVPMSGWRRGQAG